MANDGLRAAVRQLRQLVGAKAERDRLTDRQLLERFARQHDEGAFTLLMERHGAMVLSVCRGILRDS
ncbi:MAG TPA: hypothetical protein VMG10_35490 [Gemmataceae bacterium]|nr:hypothetical protein [Gemmataceae bacterium]